MYQISVMKENMATLRKLAGWSAKDLSDVFELSRPTISGIETNPDHKMSVLQYVSIRTLFGVRVNALRSERSHLKDARSMLKKMVKELDECGEDLLSVVPDTVTQLKSIQSTLSNLENTPTKALKYILKALSTLEEWITLYSQGNSSELVSSSVEMSAYLRKAFKKISKEIKDSIDLYKVFEQVLEMVDRYTEEDALVLTKVRELVLQSSQAPALGCNKLGWIAAKKVLDTVTLVPSDDPVSPFAFAEALINKGE